MINPYYEVSGVSLQTGSVPCWRVLGNSQQTPRNKKHSRKDDFEAAGRAALHIYGKQPNMGVPTVPWWDTYPLNHGRFEARSPQNISRQADTQCLLHLSTWMVNLFQFIWFLCRVNCSILWVCWLWVLQVSPQKFQGKVGWNPWWFLRLICFVGLV